MGGVDPKKYARELENGMAIPICIQYLIEISVFKLRPPDWKVFVCKSRSAMSFKPI